MLFPVYQSLWMRNGDPVSLPVCLLLALTHNTGWCPVASYTWSIGEPGWTNNGPVEIALLDELLLGLFILIFLFHQQREDDVPEDDRDPAFALTDPPGGEADQAGDPTRLHRIKDIPGADRTESRRTRVS